MLANTNAAKQLTKKAPVFAALGDETRLSLLLQLGEGSLLSITQLAEGRPQSRQAITKHLHILEEVELVSAIRRGARATVSASASVARSGCAIARSDLASVGCGTQSLEVVR